MITIHNHSNATVIVHLSTAEADLSGASPKSAIDDSCTPTDSTQREPQVSGQTEPESRASVIARLFAKIRYECNVPSEPWLSLIHI